MEHAGMIPFITCRMEFCRSSQELQSISRRFGTTGSSNDRPCSDGVKTFAGWLYEMDVDFSEMV